MLINTEIDRVVLKLWNYGIEVEGKLRQENPMEMSTLAGGPTKLVSKNNLLSVKPTRSQSKVLSGTDAKQLNS